MAQADIIFGEILTFQPKKLSYYVIKAIDNVQLGLHLDSWESTYVEGME